MFSIDLPVTVAPLELAWTSIAMLGAGIACGLSVHIWLSYCAVMRWIEQGFALRWGPRHLFVCGFLVGVLLLLVVWIGFVGLGGNAMINRPPVSPDRIAASERGGWILVGLEGTLLLFEGVLTWAWIAVGSPTLRPHPTRSTVSLLLEAIDAGRELGHLIRNRLAPSVGLIDITLEMAADRLTASEREKLIEARDSLVTLGEDAKHLHEEIKAMEPHA